MPNTDIQAVATQWLCDLEATDHPEGLWHSFRAWLDADPANLVAFIHVERLWHIASAALHALAPAAGDEDHRAFLETLEAELASCPTRFLK